MSFASMGSAHDMIKPIPQLVEAHAFDIRPNKSLFEGPFFLL